MKHLERYGLVSKSPETLDGGAALGLRLNRESQGGVLMFSGGNAIPEPVNDLKKLELFSICGKLVGHCSVAGWLHVACSFIKCMAIEVGWGDTASKRVIGMLQEVLQRVKKEDPVKGKWHVSKLEKETVWCEASSIALGVLLEMEDSVLEDAAWPRKRDNFNHINVAQLKAVMKTIKMAVKWGLNKNAIMTDSSTVWMDI